MQVRFLEETVVSDFKFKTKPYQHQYNVFMKSRNKESYALFMEQGTLIGNLLAVFFLAFAIMFDTATFSVNVVNIFYFISQEYQNKNPNKNKHNNKYFIYR